MFQANIVRSKTVDPLKVDDSVKINAENILRFQTSFFVRYRSQPKNFTLNNIFMQDNGLSHFKVDY